MTSLVVAIHLQNTFRQQDERREEGETRSENDEMLENDDNLYENAMLLVSQESPNETKMTSSSLFKLVYN